MPGEKIHSKYSKDQQILQVLVLESKLLLLPITQKDYKITFPSSHDIFV